VDRESAFPLQLCALRGKDFQGAGGDEQPCQGNRSPAFMPISRRFAQPKRAPAGKTSPRRNPEKPHGCWGIWNSCIGGCTIFVSPGCAWAALDWWISSYRCVNSV